MVYVGLEFFKGFLEFLLALGHIEGDPKVRAESFFQSLEKKGIGTFEENTIAIVWSYMKDDGEFVDWKIIWVDGQYGATGKSVANRDGIKTVVFRQK